jgi:hypothetical protein
MDLFDQCTKMEQDFHGVTSICLVILAALAALATLTAPAALATLATLASLAALIALDTHAALTLASLALITLALAVLAALVTLSLVLAALAAAPTPLPPPPLPSTWFHSVWYRKHQNYFYPVQILRSCRFISIPTHKMRPAGAIFEFAVSPKYYLHYKYSARKPTTHNTHNRTTKMDHCPLPSSRFALSLRE